MADELDGWYRVGGRTLQFYATDDEIAEWLLETLPSEQRPYAIVGRSWNGSRWRPYEFALDDVETAFSRHRSGNHWIRSDALSPRLTGVDEQRLAWNGLINVQLGFAREDGRVEDASIGIVDRIRHEKTGDERRFTEYLRLFERLRRSMRRRLVVETLYRFPSGEEGPSWRMTPRAAEAHARGDVTFIAEPVGLVD